MPPSRIFTKPARSTTALVKHLTSRGLIIPNKTAAKRAISVIGYYRLLIYMRPIQDPATKNFLAGKTFQDVIDLYEFDRELRLICLDAIERIEIALRAALSNTLAVKKTAQFYTRPEQFENGKGYSQLLQQLLRSKGVTTEHYYDNYLEPLLPPIWAVLETITIGTLSQLFSQLSLANRKIVSKTFDYDEKVLVSWFRSVAALRNKCAHHNRVWNSSADQPSIAKSLRTVFPSPAQTTMFYSRAVVLSALLAQIHSSAQWNAKLKDLFNRYPSVNPSDMGFIPNWSTFPFWK